jgi:hypothetical protein
MIPHRSEFLTTEAHRLAVAEFRHRQAVRARRWFWFRLILCALSIPVSLLWLYACAYC